MVGTDLATVTEQPNGLAVWAQGAREVHSLAEHVSQSALVPQAYRGKPVDVLACWLTGQELGIQPMAALRSIDVIQGTPSLRAHAMRALVLSRGHEVEIVESTDERCVMRGRRKASPTWQSVEWDLERAKKLNLLGRDQWKTQPRTMLIARATGELCRLVAADVLYAVPYTTEEMQDDPIRASATVDRPTAAALVEPAEAKLVFQAGEHVPVSSMKTLDDAADPEPQGISGPQLKKLGTLMTQAGVEDREARLSWVSDILTQHYGEPRTITSSKDLTRVEANVVLEQVQAFIDTEGHDGQNLDPAEGQS